VSVAHVAEEFQEPWFGHAWRSTEGKAFASVHLGTYSSLSFDSPGDARAAAAACNQAAAAMEALPEVTP
jgi:hypothetical protein